MLQLCVLSFQTLFVFGRNGYDDFFNHIVIIECDLGFNVQTADALFLGFVVQDVVQFFGKKMIQRHIVRFRVVFRIAEEYALVAPSVTINPLSDVRALG